MRFVSAISNILVHMHDPDILKHGGKYLKQYISAFQDIEISLNLTKWKDFIIKISYKSYFNFEIHVSQNFLKGATVIKTFLKLFEYL